MRTVFSRLLAIACVAATGHFAACDDTPLSPERHVVTEAPAFALAPAGGHAGRPLRVAPNPVAAGQVFTLVDAPAARLMDGSVLFWRHANGGEVDARLDVQPGGRVARGRAPSTLPNGDYTLYVRLPWGGELSAGTMTVVGTPVYPEATISPNLGPVGTMFTIHDPLGRIVPGDAAYVFPEGSDPASAVQAPTVSATPDGTTLIATIPGGATPGVQHFVLVRSGFGEARFDPLPFFVTF